ncbi:MAG: response regulator [Sediminibacterium sp.]
MKEKRILILEDELLQALDLSEFLHKEGYNTSIVDNFDDGVKAVTDFDPQLVICDINLKDEKTGIDFAKKANTIKPNIEIIFITAVTKSASIIEAQEADPLNYIVKPWKEEQVKVTVQMAFNYIASKHKQNSVVETLTMSEYKILKLIAKQMSSKEIAASLFVSEKTVKNHRHNIIQKLNLTNEKNSLLKWASNNTEI